MKESSFQCLIDLEIIHEVREAQDFKQGSDERGWKCVTCCGIFPSVWDVLNICPLGQCHNHEKFIEKAQEVSSNGARYVLYCTTNPVTSHVMLIWV